MAADRKDLMLPFAAQSGVKINLTGAQVHEEILARWTELKMNFFFLDSSFFPLLSSLSLPLSFVH